MIDEVERARIRLEIAKLATAIAAASGTDLTQEADKIAAFVFGA